MLNRLRRLLAYLKNVFLLAALWPASALLRRTHRDYRRLWLVSERGIDARDNGYWFYRYLREQRPADFGNSTLTCPKCGMTLREFENEGRVGCIECYNTFNEIGRAHV